jgi:CheY-like chemotaxis protein
MPSSIRPTIATPRRILVIDDDPVSLSLAVLLLASEGFEVEQRTSGESACHDPLPAGWQPGMVLADLRMPGLHGTALARQLELRWPAVPRIAMSAAPPRPVEGYTAVLQKPLPMQGLRAVLDDLCRVGQSLAETTSSIAIKLHKADGLPALDEDIFIKIKSRMPTPALQEFVEVMLTDAGKRIELMQKALETGDVAKAKREAHTVRGAAGMAGALALKEAARKIEVEVDSLDDLKRGLAQLEAEHQRVSVILASKLL